MYIFSKLIIKLWKFSKVFFLFFFGLLLLREDAGAKDAFEKIKYIFFISPYKKGPVSSYIYIFFNLETSTYISFIAPHSKNPKIMSASQKNRGLL